LNIDKQRRAAVTAMEAMGFKWTGTAWERGGAAAPAKPRPIVLEEAEILTHLLLSGPLSTWNTFEIISAARRLRDQLDDEPTF
jgi:hypothetical protein